MVSVEISDEFSFQKINYIQIFRKKKHKCIPISNPLRKLVDIENFEYIYVRMQNGEYFLFLRSKMQVYEAM